MSETNKILRTYGESTGHLYLTILYSSWAASNDLRKENSNVDLSTIKSAVDQYIKKEYGSGMLQSYNSFASDYSSNNKLLKELEKRHGEYTSKAIIDAIKQIALEKDRPVISKVNKAKDNSETKNDEKIANQNSDAHLESVNEPIDKQKAISALKSAVFKNPFGINGWNLLGNAYKEMGDLSNAKRCYEKALYIKSENEKEQHAESQKASQTQMTPAIQKPNNRSNPGLKENSSDSGEGYYFENEMEFMLYVKYNGGKKNIKWISSDKYLNEFKKGYLLFEQQQYQKAIEAYKCALQFNPVGTAARMEICNAYCKLGKLEEARKYLESSLPYLYSDILIGKYYRLLGYLLVEEQNYRLAAHCYQYSCNFGEHPTVKGELKFIALKIGLNILVEIRNQNTTEELFREAGIKIIKKPVLDENEEQKDAQGSNKKSRGSILECRGDLIDKGSFKGQKTATIQIELRNTGDEAFPGNVELLYPDLTKVENFKEEPIAAGSNKKWKGMWIITEEETEAGTFEFFVRYPIKKDNGDGTTIKTKKVYFKI